MVAGGTQRKVKEGNKGKKKQLTIQYKPFQWSPRVLKECFWSLDAEEILQILCFFFFNFI